jgi:hypothetical protein
MFLPWRHRRCLKPDLLLSRQLAAELLNRLLVSLSHCLALSGGRRRAEADPITAVCTLSCQMALGVWALYFAELNLPSVIVNKSFLPLACQRS